MAKLPRKYAAGFTLVELVAVLLILSSLTWLFIKSFSSTTHSSFQFTQVLQQFTARAQSLSFANQDPSSRISIRLTIDDGQAVISLLQDIVVLDTYIQPSEFELSIDSEQIDEYVLSWLSDGMFASTSHSHFVFYESGVTTSYCLLNTGAWSSGREGRSC